MENHHNQKIARLRGSEWKKSLRAGRMEVQRNPTKLRLKRMEMELTQSEMANLLGYKFSSYCSLENGNRSFPSNVASRIAQRLGIKKRELADFFNQNGKDKFTARRNNEA